MALVKLTKKVPEVYVNESRDFQLILRMYSLVLNDILFSTKSISLVTDTETTPSDVLNFLKSRIGFFTDKYIKTEELRKVLWSFPELVREKGSISAIYHAVHLFLRIKHIKSSVFVEVENYLLDIDTSARIPSFNIYIYTDEKLEDTLILDELWRYIIPTGYNVHYMTKAVGRVNPLNMKYMQSIEFAKNSEDTERFNSEEVSRIRGNSDTIIGDVSGRVQNAIDTTFIYGASESTE